MWSRYSSTMLITGALVVMLAAILQAAGFCYPLERLLVRSLPERMLPLRPQTVLLTLDSEPEGFRSLDVALILRGLSRFSPRCVVVNGIVAPEGESLPLLPGILERIREKGVGGGFPVILPVAPSPQAHFGLLPLPRSLLRGRPWKSRDLIEGVAVPGESGRFLSYLEGQSGSLPLLGSTAAGDTVASLWWDAISVGREPLHGFACFGKMLLLLEEGSPLWIDPSGSAESHGSGAAKVVPIEDFLLKVEQGERGTLSPDFDVLWQGATVVLGASGDRARCALLSGLLDELRFHRLSLGIQAALAAGAIILLAVLWRMNAPTRIVATLLVMSGIAAAAVFFLERGVMVPFLPGLVAGLLPIARPVLNCRPLKSPMEDWRGEEEGVKR